MALEAVVFPQAPFIYYPNPTRDLYNYPFVPVHELGLQSEEDRVEGILGNYSYGNQSHNYWDPTSSSPEQQQQPPQQLVPPLQQAESAEPATSGGGRRKRRRVKSSKNREEIENQRMTHIAVERNRRKQMNEYLAVLRSLMPPSYSQRGDQASIIGGAINFVKELEQLLQSMEAQKSCSADATTKPNPFSDFFSFPQYSTRPAGTSAHSVDSSAAGVTEPTASSATSEHHQLPPAAADIEVTMVESHANLKILSKKRPKQLLKLVAGLQANRLSILHLNVTSVDGLVLYSLSVKIEDGCQMNTVDEIAAAVNQIFRRIKDEAAFS